MKGLQDAANVAEVLSVALALPALAIPLALWWSRATTATAPTASQVSQAHETLAGLVARQWRHEALARSLGDPEPMPVQWRLTKHAVMDHPRLIMTGKLSFTGRSDQIGALAHEFRRSRRRRLVILGGPGSGKTTLAVQLLLELLATREAGEPIPVLVSLAGWDTTTHPQLHGWLTERLTEDYPSLLAFGPGTVRALVEQGHVLPILDGLDEVSSARQPEVITTLNTSLTEADQLVLTSRTREYKAAIAEAHTVLTAAAVIEPKPLTPIQAADYLEACLPPDPGHSWRGVLDQLRAGTVENLATVVATPLGLWLLRTVYLTPQIDPRPLLNFELAGDAAALQAHLFDQLIPTVLAARSVSRNPADPFRPRRTWEAPQVRRWLTYLAQHLNKTETRDLLWWQLARQTITRRELSLGAGLGLGLVLGLGVVLIFVLGLELVLGLGGRLYMVQGVGVGAALGSVLVIGLRSRDWLTDEPAYANFQVKHRTRLLVRDLGTGLGAGLVVGPLIGLVAGLAAGIGGGPILGPVLGLILGLILGPVLGLGRGLEARLVRGLGAWLGAGLIFSLVSRLVLGFDVGTGIDLVTALVAGLGIGLGLGLSAGLVKWVGTPSRNGWASTPHSTYTATRTLTVMQVCVSGLGAGLGAALMSTSTVGLEAGMIAGLVVGPVAGLITGLGLISSGAWLSYLVVSCRLATARKLPLRLMSFLDDAYRLGLLRRTGPAYQFRHAEFHDHLTRTTSSRAEAHAIPNARLRKP